MKKLLFLSLVLLFTACESDTSGGYTDNSHSTAQSSTTPAKTAAISIVTGSGSVLGSVSRSGHTIWLGEGQAIRSRLKGEKRKYDMPGGITLKVTYKEDGFKLKKESGELIWKIKVYDEKVKISDNEENENPYQIRFYEGDRAKLKYQEQELGEVELKDGRQLVTGSGKDFAIESDQFSAAYAALLIERIPIGQRLIIISELLAMGQ